MEKIVGERISNRLIGLGEIEERIVVIRPGFQSLLEQRNGFAMPARLEIRGSEPRTDHGVCRLRFVSLFETVDSLAQAADAQAINTQVFRNAREIGLQSQGGF